MLYINNKQNGYSPDQCGKTMTVGELISLLAEFDEDDLVYLKNNDGFTYASLDEDDFEEADYTEEE